MPLSTTDVERAAARARDVLKSRSDGDYAPQSVLGDLVVDAHAALHADIANQIEVLKQRQSLRDLSLATPGADTDDALDALLSNLVINRDAGSFARGRATIYFNAKADASLSRGTRFFKTRALVYYPNSATDIFIPASALRPVYAPGGVVTGWAYDVSLIAGRTGEAYNVSAGPFAGVDPFSPYLLGAENSRDFAGGLGIETPTAALARVPSAISLRALVNAKSNDARVREAFPEVSEVITVGAGDAAMARDVVSWGPRGAPTHTLGCVDIYPRLPLHEVTERLIVGAPALRGDRKVLTLRDSSPPSGSYLTAQVKVGDVFVLAAGLPEALAHFRIEAVRALELDVSPVLPFSSATEELTSPPSLTYTIGDNYPTFDNRVGVTTSSTLETSRRISRDGCVVLPAGPVYQITRIEVPTPPTELTPFADPATGVTYFTSRRNGPWARAPRAGEPLSYRVLTVNPLEGQSARAVTLLELGWPGVDLAGTEVLVTYETPVGFDAVAELVSGPAERVGPADSLARAHHPVYVSCSIPYRPYTTRTALGATASSVNELTVATVVASYIENSPPEDLDATSVGGIAARADSGIKAVIPFDLAYELILPDGRVARYRTSGAVAIAPTPGAEAHLENATELGLPAEYHTALVALLQRLGVTDQVVRYRAQTDGITLERR